MVRQSKAPEAHGRYNDKMYRSRTRGTKMPKLNRREMLVMWFESKGYKVVPGRTGKFLTMEKPGVEQKYFIGKKGSLMKGKNISSVGWALTDTVNWKALEKWAEGKRGSQ